MIGIFDFRLFLGGDFLGFFARFIPMLSLAQPAGAWGVALVEPALARWFFGGRGGLEGDFYFCDDVGGHGPSPFFLMPQCGVRIPNIILT